MNTDKQLSELYGLPEGRIIRFITHQYNGKNIYAKKEIVLSRDIEQLMTLAIEKKVDLIFYDDHVKCFKYEEEKDKLHTREENYKDHLTKLDAVCEALTQALLAE